MTLTMVLRRVALSAALVLCVAAPLGAQTRPAPRRGADPVPSRGMSAVGISAGFALPAADDLDPGFALAVNYEHYMSRRVSIRGQVGGAWEDIEGHSFQGTVKPMSFTGNVVYNWEGGAIHPYVTGGLGYYRFRYLEADLYSANNHFGGNLGGGMEFFMTRRDTITAEVLAHLVSGDAQGRATYESPMYWTILFGYKKYWR
jgi:hypothetical protein